VLGGFGDVLPVQLEWAAVFPSKRIAEELVRLPAASPKMVRALDRDGLVKRIQELYGLDPTSLGEWCVAARVSEAGPLVVCEAAPLTAVEGATRWLDADAPGHDVVRGDATIALRTVKGRLVAGAPEAVRRAILVSRRSWPALKDSAARWKKVLSPLDGADAWNEGAVYWLDPARAPWCIPGDCKGTAAFGSRTAFTVTAEAEAGRVDMLRLAVERTWQQAKAPCETLREQPQDERPAVLPDDLFKGGDGAVRSGQVAVRGERVSLSGEGDLAGLAGLSRLDLVKLLVGKLD
jgi:hypothetical protein